MNRKEAMRQTHQENVLMQLGFTQDEATKLRRISMTLQRWHELECGTGEGQVSRSVERDGDEPDSKPYMRVQYPTANGYVDRKHPIADRETGARKRLAAIIARVNVQRAGKVGRLESYIQGDPRGASLYILRPGDVPAGESADAYYSRGICVY